MTTHYNNEIVYSTLTGTVMNIDKSQITKTTTRRTTTNDGWIVDEDIELTTHHKISLIINDGNDDHSLRFSDIDIPLREGQVVTFILLKDKGISSFPTILINHNNQRSYQIKDNNDICAALRLCAKKTEETGWVTITITIIVVNFILTFIISIISFLFGGDVINMFSSPLGWLVAVAFYLLEAYKRLKNTQIDEIHKDFNREIQNITNEICQQVL